jgi:hypothetical protein
VVRFVGGGPTCDCQRLTQSASTGSAERCLKRSDLNCSRRPGTLRQRLGILDQARPERSGQTMDLEPDEPIVDTGLEGMEGVKRALQTGEPVVLLNACQLGPPPSLVGSRDFASAFMELRARCLFAPFWSVKYSVQAQVACALYRGVLTDRRRRFADALRELHRRTTEASNPGHSLAACCFHLNPLTFAETNCATR